MKKKHPFSRRLIQSVLRHPAKSRGWPRASTSPLTQLSIPRACCISLEIVCCYRFFCSQNSSKSQKCQTYFKRSRPMITFGTVVLNAHHSISLNFNFHVFWRFFGMKNMLYTFELCLLILLAMSLSRASSSGEVMPVTMSRKHFQLQSVK